METAEILRDLETFVDPGAGAWRVRELSLPALDALPSVVEAVSVGDADGYFDAIEEALKAGCLAVHSPWREAAFDHLGLSPRGKHFSRTVRENLAAAHLDFDGTTYRRSKRRDSKYPSWRVKTLTLVANGILANEFSESKRHSNALGPLPSEPELFRALDVGGAASEAEVGPETGPLKGELPGTSNDESDAYRRFAEGVLAYGEALHVDRRDHALVRLRNNNSLTLHVLGFHDQRVQLGTWALESAQYIDDHLSVIAILIDDLGWTRYLLGDSVCERNIEKAVQYAEDLPAGTGEPLRTLLHAKALRHLGVIRTDAHGSVAVTEFDAARGLLKPLASLSRDAAIDLAHIDYAQGLAIGTHLGVNTSGELKASDAQGISLLREALDLVQRARRAFHNLADHGRHAKALVLEVRFLSALGEQNEAAQIALLRDRSLAESVWSRPAGQASITGR